VPNLALYSGGLLRLDSGVLDHLRPLAELGVDEVPAHWRAENASKPTLRNLALTAGSSMILRSSRLSRVTTGGGVRAGATMPATRPGRSRSPRPHQASAAPGTANCGVSASPPATQRSGLDMRYGSREIGEHHRHAAGDDVLERGACSCKDMQPIDPGQIVGVAGAIHEVLATGERQLPGLPGCEPIP